MEFTVQKGNSNLPLNYGILSDIAVVERKCKVAIKKRS